MGGGRRPGGARGAAEPGFRSLLHHQGPGKGTGLGLSISYDIVVHKHEGFLRIENSDLGGARFVVELPLSQKAEPTRTPAEAP
jgi:signal transduction histidine kinase